MSIDRVAVVGGGAVGLTAAVALARRDREVTLFERDRLGSGATGRAAGLCYDAYAERTDWQVARRALDRFRDLGVVTDCPYVWATDDETDAAAIRQQAARMSANGCRVSVLDPGPLRDRFPALCLDDLVVGAVAENAGYVDPRGYLEVMATRARAGGVEIRTGTPVRLAAETTLLADGRERSFDAVLLAAGPHTARLAAQAGHSLALGAYRAQVLVTAPVEVTPPMYYDAGEEFYLRPAGQSVLIGDGVEPVDGSPEDVDRTADDLFCRQSLARLEATLGVETTVERSWAGVCTATPDRDPLLGACAEGLYVASGWHGHGFMRAPALGERIAAQMLGGAGIDHFDPTRFDGDEPIRTPAGILN